MPPLVRTPLREPPSYEAIIAALVRQRRESGVGFRAHGAMTVVALLDALYFEAAAKGTGTPRTGTSTLAYLMAPARGWEKQTPAKMIDSHKKTIRKAREWAELAGLLTFEVVQDDNPQDRATDWTLLGTPELEPEDYAEARRVIDAYRRRHPSVEGARKRSARVLGHRLRTLKTRACEARSRSRNQQSAPPPSGYRSTLSVGNTSSGERFIRARGEAAPQGLTRRQLAARSTPTPRGKRTRPNFTEDGRSGPGRLRRSISGERRADVIAGYAIGRQVLDLLPPEHRHLAGLSERAAARLGSVARLATRRLGWTAEQVAAGMAASVSERGWRLSNAVAHFRHDLRHQPWMQGHEAREARRQARLQREREQLAAIRFPAWLALHDNGVPVVWAGDWAEHVTRWLCCTTVPSAQELAQPEVRAIVRAAALKTGIAGDARHDHTPLAALEARTGLHADPLGAAAAMRSNGWTMLTDPYGAKAAVPPPWSSAAAVRWEGPVAKPTADQQRLYAELCRKAGVPASPAPRTAPEMHAAIDALLNPGHRDA